MNAQLDVEKARQIAPGCPPNCVVVHEYDEKLGHVFYKHTDTGEEIKTDFTSDHIHIASNFPLNDLDRLDWDRLSNLVNDPRFEVYTVNR